MSQWDYSVQLVADQRLPFSEMANIVNLAVEGGIGIVQLRNKQANASQLVKQTLVLSEIINRRAALIINDRLDVALAAREAGANVTGVHLGQEDVSPMVARKYLGNDALIGWTADRPQHLEQLKQMQTGTVDYLGVGVIRSTERKPDHPPVLGIEGFIRFAEQTSLPCVAIGGILPSDVSAICERGGAGVAVISAICDAPDPLTATQEFVKESQ